METSILTTKGQLLIPKRIRNKYGIKSGVKVIFEDAENGVVIRPMNENYFKTFRGMLRSSGDLKEEIRKIKEEEKQLEHAKMNRIFKAKAARKTK